MILETNQLSAKESAGYRLEYRRGIDDWRVAAVFKSIDRANDALETRRLFGKHETDAFGGAPDEINDLTSRYRLVKVRTITIRELI